MKTFHLQFIFLASLILSLILTPLFAKLARRLGLVDRPAHRKTHKEPVAFLGGVAVFSAFILAFGMTFLLYRDLDKVFTYRGFIKVLFIGGASLGVAALGLWDDIRDLRPRYKFIGQVLFALAFTLFGFHFEVLHIPGLPPVKLELLCVPLTVFWIVSVVNAFNMIDGVDGLAGTVALGCLTLMACASALVGNGMELVLALGALGAVLGFLPFNWKPAGIYLGDAGSGGLGMFLACALVALGQTYGQSSYNPKDSGLGQPFFYQIIIVTLLVAYPALEIILSVVRRLLHGRPVYRADQGHLHHRFLKAGWTVPEACLTALALTLLPGFAALATIQKEHGWATWFLSACGLILGLCLSNLGFLDFFKPHSVARSRPHFQIANHFIEMQKLKLQQAGDLGEVVTLVSQTCNEFGLQGYRLFVRPDEHGKGGYHSSWERSLKEHREYLSYLKTLDFNFDMISFKDHASIENGQGEAFWIFEPQSRESELDVEYRVLVHEFMTEVLKKIASLKPENREMDSKILSMLPHHGKGLGSSFLRRRQQKDK